MPEAAAPNASVVEAVPQPAPSGRRTAESIADDVYAFMNEEPAPKPAKEPKQAKSVAEQPVQEPAPRTREVTLPGDDGKEADGDDAVGEHPGDETNAEPDNQVDEGGIHADEPTPGHSREHPFPAKELPKDRFVEVTVDGEKQVVDMAELARGYIGFQTTQRRLTAASELTKQAESFVQKAQESQAKVRQSLEVLFDDDEELYNFMLERNEGVLLKVAQRMGERVKRFREDPNLFERERIQREERRVQAERARLEQERQAAEHQRQQQRVMQERAAEFNPGWAEGLKRAGFPKLTEEQGKELFDEVILRCNQRYQGGKPVTRAEVAEFVVRACKLLDFVPKNGTTARPAPARVAAPPRREPPKNGNGSKNWDSMPQSRRLMDPDYLLERSGVSAREFRR